MHRFTHRIARTTALAAMLHHPLAAFAAKTWTVNTCADPGAAAVDCRYASYDGSFRTAFTCASDGDTVDAAHLPCDTITLSSGLLNLDTTNFSVVGPGKNRLRIDLDGKGNIVHTGPHVQYASLSGLTLENGRSYTYGGCLYSYGNLRLSDVRIRNCLASPSDGSSTDNIGGGGIFALGAVRLVNSAVVGNTAAGFRNTQGGGIYAIAVEIIASTVSGNVARGSSNTYVAAGGGIAIDVGPSVINRSTLNDNEASQGAAVYSGGGESLGIYESTFARNAVSTGQTGLGGTINARFVEMYNSTMAGNTSTQGQPRGLSVPGAATQTHLHSVILADGANGEGGTIGGDHNLFFGTASNIELPADTLMADPQLGPLTANGGPTETMLPHADSPALGHGINPLNDLTDQRGSIRHTLDHVDIGAVERDGVFRSDFDEF